MDVVLEQEVDDWAGRFLCSRARSATARASGFLAPQRCNDTCLRPLAKQQNMSQTAQKLVQGRFRHRCENHTQLSPSLYPTTSRTILCSRFGACWASVCQLPC